MHTYIHMHVTFLFIFNSMTTLENDGYSEGTYNESFNLGNKFSMGGSYKLVQIHCHQPSEESIAVGANKRSLQHEHNKRMSGLKKHNIMANFKEGAHAFVQC